LLGALAYLTRGPDRENHNDKGTLAHGTGKVEALSKLGGASAGIM
jgi:hypothetical protein